MVFECLASKEVRLVFGRDEDFCIRFPEDHEAQAHMLFMIIGIHKPQLPIRLTHFRRSKHVLALWVYLFLKVVGAI